MFTRQQPFVATNVADDLNTRIPRRVLLDQKADRGREARREAAGREDRDFRLRRGSGLVRARGRSLGCAGEGSAAAAAAGLGVPGRRVAAAVFCRAEREAPCPFCSFRAPRAAAPGRRNQKLAARRRNSDSKSGGAPQRMIPRIRQVSDAARIGNRKQRACQRRLLRVVSPVSAACEIQSWLRQRF